MSSAVPLLLMSLLLLPHAGAGQTVTVTHSTTPVDVLTVNDVDFVNSTTPKLLFTVTATLVPPPASLTVYMEIALNVQLSTGESFPKAAFLKTTPFLLNTTQTFTNLDFRNPATREEYRVDEAARQRFEDVARPSGIMPPGRYSFDVRIFEAATPPGGTPLGDNGFDIDLTNPSTVQLLVPLDADDAMTQFPLFQWLFDGPKSRLSIFEKLPVHQSFEQAASGVPYLTAEVAGTSYQYPSAGVRALVPGRTYVWYVEGIIRVSGGTEQLVKSPIRSFRVIANAATGEITLLDMLEQALDPKYRSLFDQLREQGFAATGTIRRDGASLSKIDFQQLLSQLRTNPDNVLSVRVE